MDFFEDIKDSETESLAEKINAILAIAEKKGNSC